MSPDSPSFSGLFAGGAPKYIWTDPLNGGSVGLDKNMKEITLDHTIRDALGYAREIMKSVRAQIGRDSDRYLQANPGEKTWRIPSGLFFTGEIVGCDIHTKTEIRKYLPDGITEWVEDGPDWRDVYAKAGAEHPEFHMAMWDFRYYTAFACLAPTPRRPDVRSMSPARGWPDDWKQLAAWYKDAVDRGEYSRHGRPNDQRAEWVEHGDLHTASWYTLHELLIFDYDQRCTDQPIVVWDETAGKEVERHATYREVLSSSVLRDVETLREWAAGRETDPEDVRIVFAFDN